MDVIDLRNFYAQPLGQTARRILSRHIQKIWGDVRGQRIAGLGFATPYLTPFHEEAERVLALMPARQGVIHWPNQGRGLTTLVDEISLPLPDASIDRMLLVHALENSESLRLMLREVWRVLAPGGQILVVVPNRRSLWARMETSPFGQGRPFSRTQITSLLRDTLFSPMGWNTALYMPPIAWRFLRRSAQAWERIGGRIWPGFAGVLLVEASKQIYAAPARQGATARTQAREAVEKRA